MPRGHALNIFIVTVVLFSFGETIFAQGSKICKQNSDCRVESSCLGCNHCFSRSPVVDLGGKDCKAICDVNPFLTCRCENNTCAPERIPAADIRQKAKTCAQDWECGIFAFPKCFKDSGCANPCGFHKEAVTVLANVNRMPFYLDIVDTDEARKCADSVCTRCTHPFPQRLKEADYKAVCQKHECMLVKKQVEDRPYVTCPNDGWEYNEGLKKCATTDGQCGANPPYRSKEECETKSKVR